MEEMEYGSEKVHNIVNEEHQNEKYVQEGNARIKVRSSVFYNPYMELNRDISSLIVGALGEEFSDFSSLTVCDGMAASGLRGIRYGVENNNVKSITFVDGDENACRLIEENLNLNGLSSISKVVHDDINHHLYRGGTKYNFVELDPFGSPVPFIRAALLNLRASKKGILSVTATDTIVLCGVHSKACIINYGAKPMRGPICHEVGLRIIIADIVRNAAPLHLGIKPVFSLSKRHYMKVITIVEKSAKSAYESMMKLGFVSMCQSCGNIKTYAKPNIDKKCQICGSQLDWAGPLWLGEIENEKIIEKAISLNNDRNYNKKKEINSILSLLKSESSMPPFYFDLHAIADKYGTTSPKLEDVINSLKAKGFLASRTSFSPTAIKTNASIIEIANLLGLKVNKDYSEKSEQE